MLLGRRWSTKANAAPRGYCQKPADSPPHCELNCTTICADRAFKHTSQVRLVIRSSALSTEGTGNSWRSAMLLLTPVDFQRVGHSSEPVLPFKNPLLAAGVSQI
jgi:hypothetical protein